MLKKHEKKVPTQTILENLAPYNTLFNGFCDDGGMISQRILNGLLMIKRGWARKQMPQICSHIVGYVGWFGRFVTFVFHQVIIF